MYYITEFFVKMQHAIVETLAPPRRAFALHLPSRTLLGRRHLRYGSTTTQKGVAFAEVFAKPCSVVALLVFFLCHCIVIVPLEFESKRDPCWLPEATSVTSCTCLPDFANTNPETPLVFVPVLLVLIIVVVVVAAAAAGVVVVVVVGGVGVGVGVGVVGGPCSGFA